MGLPDKPTKRPPGRPKLPAGLKAEQFSIALPPTQRIGLEMLARHRGVSLSQAVAFCVAGVLREYEIDGKSIDARLHVMRDKAGRTFSDVDEGWAGLMLKSLPRRIMWFPPSVRTPEEQYFARVAKQAGVDPIADSESLDQLYKLSKKGWSKGLLEAEIVEEWRAKMGKNK